MGSPRLGIPDWRSWTGLLLDVGGLPLCPRPWAAHEMGGPEALTCWLSARDRQGFLPGPSPWGWPELRAVGLKLWGSLQDEKVWSYAGGQLRPGFPRLIGDEFPGVPGGLDAAVECHPEECGGETVLFFKGERRGGAVGCPGLRGSATPYEPCCPI